MARRVFARTAQITEWHEMAPDWPAFAAKMALRADSFVASLDDAKFAEGLAAIEQHARNHPQSGPIGLNIDTIIYRCTS